MLKTELTLSIILGHLIVTKYALQNSTEGHLCHLSKKLVHKMCTSKRKGRVVDLEL